MDLIRELLLEIEKQYVSTAIYNLTIDGYDKSTIVYHCKILYDAGLISDYKVQYANNEGWSFGVGPLTWEGNEYLDKIRDNSIWEETKDVIAQKGLPLVFDTIKTIATALVETATEGLVNSIIKNGGGI